MIILLGLAGSGKTTQGKLLAESLKCSWLSIGEQLRKSVNPDQQKELNAGHLLADDVVLGVLEKALNGVDAAHNEVVLDGCPRTVRQAEWLLAEPYKITAVIHILTDEETVIERLKLRARADDHEDAISQRFAEYKRVIIPIIDLMKSHNVVVHEIDGGDGTDAVFGRIKLAMGIQ